MAKWTRREWMERTALFGAAITLPTLPGCDDDESLPDPDPCTAGANDAVPTLQSYAYSGTPGPADLFQHGIASGDPLTDRVILWTRVTPASDATIEVWWEVSLDAAFTRRVAQGTFATDATRDYTVKVDATGLLPGRTYFYRFFALGVQSPVGRTRTAPSGKTNRLRFAVVSCSSYAHGYFHAYRRIAERLDIDAVVHLGDYIYEYGTGEYGDVRPYDPATEILTLDDYRRRYRYYRKDADLVAAHQQHPFIAIWDDHEVADNAWKDGAENHDPATEGSYAARKAAAVQAYMEWMPIREQGGAKIYRTLPFGDLADLVLLDTRHAGRDQQIKNQAGDTRDRSILGAEQESWVASELAKSTARYRLVANQVVFAPTFLIGAPYNMDAWDGYPAARQRMFDAIVGARGDVVILTGDVHSSWVQECPRDPNGSDYDPASGKGSLAVEFVVPSVTSSGIPDANGSITDLLMSSNPHLHYVEVASHGYCVVDVRPSKVQCDYYYVADVSSPSGGTEVLGASYTTLAGSKRVTEMSTSEPSSNACMAAPV